MKYYLQILGTDTVDASPTVLVHFDSQRYLFNCGEGTQRFCHEHKARLAKVKNVFLTRMAWDCVGGLPGMLLTLADAGTSSLTLNGPNNLTHFMAATRHFIYRESLDLSTHEFHRQNTDYKDENMTVTPVYLTPDDGLPVASDSKGNENEDTPNLSKKRKSESSHEEYESKKRVLGRMFPSDRGVHPLSSSATPSKEQVDTTATVSIPAGGGEEAVVEATGGKQNDSVIPHTEIGRIGSGRLPKTEPDSTVLSYICRGPELKGKFDAKAADALGVPRGPLRGNLARGESVTLEDGRTFTPDQVLGPSRPGAIFVIIDCPSTDYIGSLVASSTWAPLQSPETKAKNPVRCMVHMVGDGVLEDLRYKTWMNMFGKETQHLIINRRHNPVGISYYSAGNLQHKLHALDEKVFPLPYYHYEADIPIDSIQGLPPKTIPATPLTNFILEPKPELDASEALKPFKPSKTVSKREEQVALVNRVREKVAEEVKMRTKATNGTTVVGDDDVFVVPLGTGSAIPGKYRNVSSTLVTLPTGNVLLDAGEGTLGQLFRHFGPSLRQTLQSLKFLFISHLHADHHLGTIRILKYWSSLQTDRNTKLVVIAPGRYRIFLEEYADCEDFGFERLIFIDAEEVRWDPDSVVSPKTDSDIQHLKEVLSLTTIHTVLVPHCPWAYALLLTHNNPTTSSKPFTFVYSGDCRPSLHLISTAQTFGPPTLLIHEATLSDSKQTEAIHKRHCTTSEALTVGRRMGAENILLTHFSQRYPKIPDLGGVGGGEGVVGLAYDLMRVNVREFWRVGMLVEGLKGLFGSGDSGEEGEDGEE